MLPRPAAGLSAAILSAATAASHPNLLFFLAAASALSLLCLANHPLRCRRPRRRPTAVAMKPTATTTATTPFSSPDSLSDWLRPRLPSGALATWGVAPGTKTLTNLWLELSQGETSLTLLPDPDHGFPDHKGAAFTPIRAVHVATVMIRNGRGAVLVESAQLMSDGSVRHRSRPLSEKMKPGERAEEAAVRAVREELGKEVVRVVEGSYEMRVEERDSKSYPGLKARYVLHSVDVEVEGLPEEGEFSTEENGECVEAIGNAVFVKRHFWKWVDDYEGTKQN